MKNLKFSKIKSKNLKLINFLRTIKEKNFFINKSFENTPWIHFKDPRFVFHTIEISKKIVGLVVIIKFKNHDHLQFLYITQKYRSQGIGYKVIEDLLNKKRFTTVHVYKNLSNKVIKFYQKNGFKLSNLREKNLMLKNWISRCNNYNLETFKKKKLLYWKKQK